MRVEVSQNRITPEAAEKNGGAFSVGAVVRALRRRARKDRAWKKGLAGEGPRISREWRDPLAAEL